MLMATLCLVVTMMAGGVTLARAHGRLGRGSGPETFDPDFVTLLKDAMGMKLPPGELSLLTGSALNVITQLDMPLRSAIFDDDEEGDGYDSMAGVDFSQNFIDVKLPMLPRSDEDGVAYAVVLDAAALDVVRYDLGGGGDEPKVTHSAHSALPPLGPGAGRLFDFVAGFVWGLALSAGDLGHAGLIPIGFVYPFPVNQTRLNHGYLIEGTKEADLAGLVGKDPMTLLSAALEARAPGKKQETFKVAALANDAVDLLSECAYKHQGGCSLGIILGEGYNIAYFDGRLQTTINTEMGDFSGLRRSAIDKETDARSLFPGAQQLEKMISTAYLGELLRAYAIELFGADGVPPTWSTPFSVDVDYLFTCAYAKQAPGTAPEKRALMSDLCTSILKRSVRLAARTILAIAMRAGLPSGDVAAGIRGRLYERPEYRRDLADAVARLAPPGVAGRLSFVALPAGMGLGGAVMAKEFVRYGWPLVDVTAQVAGQEIKNYYRCCCDLPKEGKKPAAHHTGRCVVRKAQGKKCKQQPQVPWAPALYHYSRTARSTCMVPEDETQNGVPTVMV